MDKIPVPDFLTIKFNHEFNYFVALYRNSWADDLYQKIGHNHPSCIFVTCVFRQDFLVGMITQMNKTPGYTQEVQITRFFFFFFLPPILFSQFSPVRSSR